jgi:hypothetical protein
MRNEMPLGLTLYKKSSSEAIILKELLQLLRTFSPQQSNSFSFIDAKNSLFPHLTLKENILLEAGPFLNWKEFCGNLNPDQLALANLLTQPEKKTIEAASWEMFLVSLIKGLINPSKNLLIDMDESLYSSIIIENFKKSIILCSEKNIYLATSNTNFWIDCAHSIVNKKEYNFEIENLKSDIKKKWAA